MLNKLPKEFLERLNLIYSKEELEVLEKGFSCKKRKPTFRVNTLKWTSQEIEEYFSKTDFKIEKIPALENSYTLLNWTEKDLWSTPINLAWKIYLQWISSQVPVMLMDVKEWDKILDLTASPGSKTSQIAAKLWNTWEIIACDLNQIRIDKLEFTLKRQWVRNTKILKIDSRFLKKINEAEDEAFDDFPTLTPWYFDSILLDAPCSSEWRINLNDDKVWSNWTLWNIKRNFKIQRDMLRNNMDLLKEGGELLYSTCTLAPEENEAVVHFILCNFPELEIVDISSDSKIENSKKWILKFWKTVYKKEIEKSLRIIPSEETEGFFVAKFIKKSV